MTRGMTAIREALRGWGDAQTVDVCIGEDTVVVTVGEFRLALDAQAERARCAAACREVAARYRYGACGCEECEGRSDGARECAEAIDRGEGGR